MWAGCLPRPALTEPENYPLPPSPRQSPTPLPPSPQFCTPPRPHPPQLPPPTGHQKGSLPAGMPSPPPTAILQPVEGRAGTHPQCPHPSVFPKSFASSGPDERTSRWRHRRSWAAGPACFLLFSDSHPLVHAFICSIHTGARREGAECPRLRPVPCRPCGCQAAETPVGGGREVGSGLCR